MRKNMSSELATIISKETLQAAPNSKNGAQFYKCALQINPYQYLTDYKSNHPTLQEFQSENEYNQAMVRKLLEEGISVIAITDHYRIQTAKSLKEEAEKHGIIVFPGFEARCKNTVHYLCLFSPNTDLSEIEKKINHLTEGSGESPRSNLDPNQLIDKCAKDWGIPIIAAHVLSSVGGMLAVLPSEWCMDVWRNPNLLACSLAQAPSDLDDSSKQIILNKNNEYKRIRAISVINAIDVCHPDDLTSTGATCWIKMSSLSTEGLRQAFLDPESRIRLSEETLPKNKSEILSLSFDGEGFFRNLEIELNSGLNVLIGGRGSGKSTIIEAIRYALGLDYYSDMVEKIASDLMKNVISQGTKITVKIKSHKPTEKVYLIERTFGNDPVVKNENGQILSDLRPSDVVPKIDLFGQHEIAEIARDSNKLTKLLDRFVEKTDQELSERQEILEELKDTRKQLLGAQEEYEGLEEKLAMLPKYKEQIKRYKDAGLDECLNQQQSISEENTTLTSLKEEIADLAESHEGLDEDGYDLIEAELLEDDAIAKFPSKERFQKIKKKIDAANIEFRKQHKEIIKTISTLDSFIAVETSSIEEAQEELNKTIRGKFEELGEGEIDYNAFVNISSKIAQLEPQRATLDATKTNLVALQTKRKEAVTKWQEHTRQNFNKLKKAAREVSKSLEQRLQVNVSQNGIKQPLYDVIKEHNPGKRLSPAFEILGAVEDLQPVAFADYCREGADKLTEIYGLTKTQAENLASAGEKMFLAIEELELPAETIIQLNVAPAVNQPPEWKPLRRLSTGQKATALLLLLYIASEHPLIVDQPEDDLDNEFISNSVVPLIKEEKHNRQFLFSSHNANIPVLGDAELVLCLTAEGEASTGHATIENRNKGAIDDEPVANMIKTLLEGGETAFSTRRLKYNF